MRHQMHYSPGDTCFMQDATHMGLKLRNRLLKSWEVIPMGNKQVSASHLKLLIQEVPKMIHGLVYTDVAPDDRQNFKALQKCMDIRVRNALHDFIPDSEATAFFLSLCSDIISSLMDNDMTPHERIEKLFHAVYFLRGWKKWISSSQYNMHNFITDNAYVCIEVNASNILSLIRKFRNEEKPELFLTTLFDSQACERTFRLLRSMGTVNFTKITFTIFELMHMVRKVEVQNEIAYTKLSKANLPKLDKPRSGIRVYSLPSEEEIDQCLERAKRFALDNAIHFGMQINVNDINECKLKIPKKRTFDDGNEYNEDGDSDASDYCDSDEEADTESDNNYDDDVDDENDEVSSDSDEENGHAEFEQNAEITDNESSKSAFLIVKNPRDPEEDLLLRKSTYVWSLTEGKKKISSDRLVRVKNESTKNNQIFAGPLVTPDQPVNVSRLIKIGDWCFFKYELDDEKMFCLGSALAFKFNKGKIAKDKKYNGNFVNLEENPSHATDVDVLSSWYFVNERGHLVPTKSSNHHFIQLKNYIATVEKPQIDPIVKTLFYSPDDFEKIENTILNLNKNG